MTDADAAKPQEGRSTMVTHGSLHEISQAIGSLQGELRASQRAAEDFRVDMRQQLSAIDASVLALARVTTNFESMRTEYHERFGNIARGTGEHELRIRAAEKQLGEIENIARANAEHESRMRAAEKQLSEIEARYRANSAWIASLSAVLGGMIVAAVDYLLGRH